MVLSHDQKGRIESKNCKLQRAQPSHNRSSPVRFGSRKATVVRSTTCQRRLKLESSQLHERKKASQQRRETSPCTTVLNSRERTVPPQKNANTIYRSYGNASADVSNPRWRLSLGLHKLNKREERSTLTPATQGPLPSYNTSLNPSPRQGSENIEIGAAYSHRCFCT